LLPTPTLRMPTDVRVRFTPVQSRILRDPARFIVGICGRRGGKTFLANAKLVQKASTLPRSLNWYIGPTLDDARQLMYEPLLEMLEPTGLVRHKNGTQLSIRLANGSVLQGLSADKAKRGRGVDFAAMDEFAHWDNFDYVWQQEVRPALSDKEGEAFFITTPKGYNHAYDLYARGLEGGDWSSHQWTTAEGGYVSDAEIDAARADLDPRVFRQEYEASFETMSHLVYDNFDRKLSVAPVEDTGAEILVGMDFNVNPMSAVVAVRAADECHVLDSLEILTSNTEEMADELRARYPTRRVIVCPDPSGRARKTSAPVSVTDFTILERHGFEVRAPRKAPPVVDRINNTQSMLLSGDGRRRVKIHPRCKALIRGLDGLTYKEGTSQVDKNLGLDHICDAHDYLLWQEFNVLEDRAVQAFTFRI
jgi:hypothetical protein